MSAEFTLDGYHALLNRLVHGPRFGPSTPRSFIEWTERLADAVEEAIDGVGATDLEPRFAAERATMPLSELLGGPVPDDVFTMHAVELVEGIVMTGLSAEVVTQYAEPVRKAFDGRTVVPVGCIDGSYGYLPTEQMIVEGGYESERFFKGFGLGGCSFKPGLEGKIDKIAGKVAKRLGSTR